MFKWTDKAQDLSAHSAHSKTLLCRIWCDSLVRSRHYRAVVRSQRQFNDSTSGWAFWQDILLVCLLFKLCIPVPFTVPVHHPRAVYSYAHIELFKVTSLSPTDGRQQSMTSRQDKGINSKSRPPKALETLSGAHKVLSLWLGQQYQSLSFSPILRISLGLFLHPGRMHYNRPRLEQEPYRCRRAREQAGAEGGEEELWKLKGAAWEPLASFQSG